jgi:hypothetical protein
MENKELEKALQEVTNAKKELAAAIAKEVELLDGKEPNYYIYGRQFKQWKEVVQPLEIRVQEAINKLADLL